MGLQMGRVDHQDDSGFALRLDQFLEDTLEYIIL